MGSKILLVTTLLLFGVLLFGCTDIGGGGAAPAAPARGGGEVAPAPDAGGADGAAAGEAGGAEVEAREVSGALGETLDSGAAELTVHSYRFDSKIGYGTAAIDSGLYASDVGDKFVVLNITLKNLRREGLNPYSWMKMFESSTDTYGNECSTAAAEIMRGGFSSSRMGANEERNGLIACKVDVQSRTIKFKFDTITVDVYKYSDVADQLTARGGVGAWVSSPHSPGAIRVDSCNFITDADDADPTTFKGVTYSYDGKCYNDQSISPGPGSAAACAILVINLTVKENNHLPWNTDYGIAGVKLKVGSPGQEVTRTYNTRFFEVLDRPLNLLNMAPGEERQGQLVYLVGDGIPSSSAPVVLYAHNIVTFGTLEVDCRQRGAPAVAAQQQAVVQARDG